MFDAEYGNRLDTFVQERIEQTGTPGLALAIVSGDCIVHSSGFGLTSVDPEQTVAITPNTLFRIGSTTKPLTGTLLMRLVEAGKLSLDEPIITYLPWFTLSDPDATFRVTLRHLMSHQSGLPWGSQFFGYRDSEGLEAYVREQVPRLSLIAPPGVLFSYSNVGVNVAGCIAQAVGGAPFADLMQNWVFQPLAMERTTFDPLRAISFPLAQAHEKTEQGMQVQRGEPWAENVAYRPSAMAFSTVLDMANFSRLHLNHGKFGEHQLLSKDSVEEMQRTQVDEYQTDGRTVGLNFALTHYKGHRRLGHGGGIASFGSIFTMLPDVGVAVLLQFNDSSFWQVAEEVVRHIFDAALQQSYTIPIASDTTFVRVQSGLLQHYCGTFLGPRSGLVRISIAPDAKSLRLSRIGTPGEVILTPIRHDLYTGRNISTGEEEVAGFITLKEGPHAGTVMHVMLNGAPCARVEQNPNFIVNPETGHLYSGTYEGPDETSPSGFDILRLECEEGKLNIYSRNRARQEEAIPWEEGCFVYRGRFLRFRNHSLEKAVTTFTLGDEAAPYIRIPS